MGLAAVDVDDIFCIGEPEAVGAFMHLVRETWSTKFTGFYHPQRGIYPNMQQLDPATRSGAYLHWVADKLSRSGSGVYSTAVGVERAGKEELAAHF